ncbi:hypothetical protein CEXT_692901 [Caerostris extrusa]|uniref:Uncharacterized protein n=1 Tax=Caerostris extrusa TaxID=172846 RepID=A0AAV4P1G5_CAEEX|nr:hypothetical protein CEXT_692901 [Caerostris extrusa]
MRMAESPPLSPWLRGATSGLICWPETEKPRFRFKKPLCEGGLLRIAQRGSNLQEVSLSPSSHPYPPDSGAPSIESRGRGKAFKSEQKMRNEAQEKNSGVQESI